MLKPRGHMHAMWNAGDTPGRIVEVIIPGGFEQYFAELGGLIVAEQTDPAAFDNLAAHYGLRYGHPDWLDDVIARYDLQPPTHGTMSGSTQKTAER